MQYLVDRYGYSPEERSRVKYMLDLGHFKKPAPKAFTPFSLVCEFCLQFKVALAADIVWSSY